MRSLTLSRKRDNSSLPLKLALRREALAACKRKPPFVLDAFAGLGEMHRALYSDLNGVAIDNDPNRAGLLPFARPTWTCLDADAVSAIENGLLAQYDFDLIDLDPYGNPWPAVLAVIASIRREVVLIVTDGMRSKIRISDGFAIKSIAPMLQRFGASLHDRYLDACRWRLENEGARVLQFRGAYAGANKAMTYWWAGIEPTRTEAPSPSPSLVPANGDTARP